MYRSGFGCCAGLGDMLNPTAGTALDCGLFAGGVFNKACWCLEYPSLCSADSYAAAYSLAHPDLVYGSMPEAVPPYAAPLAPGGTVDLGGEGLDVAGSLPASLAAGALEQSQQNVQGYMADVAQNIASIAPPGGGSSWNWALAIGAIVLLGVALSGGRSRGR